MESRGGDSRRILLSSLAVGLLTLVALAITSPGLPMAWDEGYAIRRAERIIGWTARGCPLGREAIADGWQYTTQVEGHPAFSGILIALGLPAKGLLGLVQSSRLGPIVLFAVAAAVLFYRLARDWSLAAGLSAAAALLLMPRLFAHAHFAHVDGPLTATWILAWAALVAARESRWAIGWFALALGAAMATKITGWLLVIPLVAWAACYRDRPALRALALGVPGAVVVFWLLNPPLWHAPVSGLGSFLELNMNRAAHWDLNISTQFLGRMYDLQTPLPWYNTLLWTAITVPVGLLALAVLGLGVAIARWRIQPLAVLVVVCWAVLVIARALPGVPPHDGVRLFLPSFAMLAALIGLGCDSLWRIVGSARRLATRCSVIAAYAGAATSLAWYAPQWLSYYNLLIGGLPGAAAAGMEPTYYWDSLDRPVLDWLHAHTGPGEKVLFGSPSWANLALMRREGLLTVQFEAEAPGQFAWYVLQRRPSAWRDADEWLVEHRMPAYRKTIRPGGWGPWRLNVPLLEVYAYADLLAADKALRAE